MTARKRHFWSGVLGVFLLVELFFSSVFIAAEINHDCSGSDCAICQVVQICLDNFQVFSSPLSQETKVVHQTSHDTTKLKNSLYLACAVTLQSLSVRFNE